MDVVKNDFDRMGIQDWRGIAMDRGEIMMVAITRIGY